MSTRKSTKVKRIYIWAAILLVGLAMLPFFFRFPGFNGNDRTTSFLYSDFNEVILGTLGRSDSVLTAASPGFGHRAIWLDEDASNEQIAAALRGVDTTGN